MAGLNDTDNGDVFNSLEVLAVRVIRVRRMLLSPELWAAEVACTQVQAASHWWCRNQCNVATTPLSQSIFF